EPATETDASTLRDILTGVLVSVNLNLYTFIVGDIPSLLINTHDSVLPTSTIVQRIIDHQTGHTNTNSRPLRLVHRTNLRTSDHEIRSNIAVGLRRSIVAVIRHDLRSTGVEHITEQRIKSFNS